MRDNLHVFAKAFGAAFGLNFIAELGDKTQIAILTLSARYGFVPVFAGAALAFVILNALAVTVGAIIAKYVPQDVIRYLAAAVFILFGLLSFRPEKVEEKGKTTKSPLITSLLVVALMEFGDKTQLSLVALTSKYRAPLAIFLGGTAALFITSLIGALVGEGLSRVIPIRWMRIASGIVFMIFGILLAAGIL